MSSLVIASNTLIAGAIEQDLDELFPAEPWLEEKPEAVETRSLKHVPPGPWRSLGRCLDYTNWPDRDRFLELDRAIQKCAEQEDLEERIETAPSYTTFRTDPIWYSSVAVWGLRPIGRYKTSRQRAN